MWLVSKRQTEIALLEAEYSALSQSMKDLFPTRELIHEVVPLFGSILEAVMTHATVFEDNQGAIAWANALRMMPQSKHIGINYHFV